MNTKQPCFIQSKATFWKDAEQGSPTPLAVAHNPGLSLLESGPRERRASVREAPLSGLEGPGQWGEREWQAPTGTRSSIYGSGGHTRPLHSEEWSFGVGEWRLSAFMYRVPLTWMELCGLATSTHVNGALHRSASNLPLHVHKAPFTWAEGPCARCSHKWRWAHLYAYHSFPLPGLGCQARKVGDRWLRSICCFNN